MACSSLLDAVAAKSIGDSVHLAGAERHGVPVRCLLGRRSQSPPGVRSNSVSWVKLWPTHLALSLPREADRLLSWHKEIARTDVEIHINVPCKSYGGDIHIHLWRGTKKEMYIPYDEENRCFQDDIPEKVYKEIYKQIEKAKRMLEQMRKTGG